MAVRPGPVNCISVCSGIGGLDLGVHDALIRLGYAPRTVLYIERELTSAGVLAARMAEGMLDEAPIYSDLTTFDGRPWRRRIHLVFGGIPCQPHSHAGQRKGIEDDRNLWPFVEQLLRDTGADAFLLENVDAIRSSSGGEAIGEILEGLARLGLVRWRWIVLPASAVGSPQQRKRFFLLATRPSMEHAEGVGVLPVPRALPAGPAGVAGAGEGYGDASADASGDVAHGSRQTRRSAPRQPERGGGRAPIRAEQEEPGRRVGDVADDHLQGRGAQPGVRLRRADAEDSDGRDGRLAHRESRSGRPSVDAQGRQPDPRHGHEQLADSDAQCHPAGPGAAAEGPGEGGGAGPDHRRAAGDESGVLADGSGPGLEGWAGVGGDAQSERSSAERGGDGQAVPTGRRFPPGPADYSAWLDILEERPWLVPALPTPESLLRGGIDGTTLWMVLAAFAHKSPSLRALGNTVHPGQAGIACYILFRAVGW